MKIKISLSQKVLLSMGSLIASGLVVLLYISHTMVLNSFARLEKNQAYTDIERAKKSIEGELENLVSTCGDWAPWDDSRNFMLGNAPDYNNANLTVDGLANLRLNFMIFIDTSDKIFKTAAVDIEKSVYTQVPSALIDRILADKSLLHIKDPAKSEFGLIILSQETVLFAAQPITNSKTEGPISGTLIVGRYLDDNLIKTISERTRLDISIAYNDDSAKTPDFKKTETELSNDKNIVVRVLDKDTIAGYTNIYDIDGSKYITLKAKMPREIFKQGHKTLHYFMVVIALTVLVMLVILLFVMQQIVLRPINGLTENFMNIGQGIETNTKLYTGRKDEIGSLARSFDTMMENLKKRMLELDESQNLVRSIIDTDPAVIFVRDNDGRFVLVNEAMAKLFNTTCHEMIGKTDWNYLGNAIASAEEINKYIADDRKVIRTQKPLFIPEESFTSPQGWTRWLQTYKIPISIKGNQCALGIGVDITDRKKHEDATNSLNRQLVKTADRLEQMNARLKNFIKVASHDLREPLRKVLVFCRLLEKSLGGNLTPDDAENFGFVIEGANRMMQIVNGLLAYSAVDTKAEGLKTVDMNKIVERLKLTVFSDMPADNKVTIDVPEPLPRVSADAVLIRQLMHNLISNGIKYQKKGSKPHITITAKPAPDEMVRIEVTDNGIGIKPEYHQAIFGIFKRLYSQAEYEGTGISLAICEKIIDWHGGKIGVESQPDKGSTFWFTLPLATAPVEAVAQV